MLFATQNGVGSSLGQASRGLGATRTLVKGTDFNCNATICFGIGAANHGLFLQLQLMLNRFPSHAPIAVDGFIGNETMFIAQAVAHATLLASNAMTATKEAVAANAPALIAHFTDFLTPPPTPTPTPTRPTVVATTSTPTPTLTTRPVVQPVGVVPAQPVQPSVIPTSSQAAALTPLVLTKAKIPTWVWITAGVSGAVVVGLIGFALRKPAPTALYDYGYRHHRRGYRG